MEINKEDIKKFIFKKKEEGRNNIQIATMCYFEFNTPNYKFAVDMVDEVLYGVKGDTKPKDNNNNNQPF